MTELSQLKWHCRRGMKELDVVLSQYLEDHYQQAYQHEKKEFKSAFKELLSLEDPVLYAMLLGNLEPANPIQGEVLHTLRNMNSTT